MQGVSIEVRYHTPPDDLARYFTSCYFSDVQVMDGGVIGDTLQPEWASLRLFSTAGPDRMIAIENHVAETRFFVTGPISRAGRFTTGTNRSWGISLLPLGWARFVGLSAQDYANRVVDGFADPAFARFAQMADGLFGPEPDEASEFERIVAFFRGYPGSSVRDEERILKIHQAMIDPDISTVAEMVETTGISQRTLERLCKRHFGFNAKLLLRRQRFLRSLAQYMLDPSRRWIEVLDPSYHDQAQFVRDFREFMGTTPSEYAAAPHPVLNYYMAERARIHPLPARPLAVSNTVQAPA